MQPEAGSVMLTADQRTLPYKVILALAGGGIAETAYLTLVSKRTGGSPGRQRIRPRHAACQVV
jgi:hypothetical protein